MKNLQQIQLIHQALEAEHNKYLQELAKVNNMIAKKTLTIQKMVGYKKEYANDGNLQLTKSVPVLLKNLDSFLLKMDDVIQQEELEIIKLNRIRDSILGSLSKIDQKTRLMEMFSNRVTVEALTKENKLEQVMLDDLAGTLHLRGDHE